MMIALWMAIRIVEFGRKGRQPWGWWVGLGLVWGMGVYLRASALWGIVPLLVCVLWLRRRADASDDPPFGTHSLKGGLLGSGVAIAIVFLLLMPWLVRNYGIFHSGFMRLTTLEGISLYEAVYPPADGSPKQDKIPLPVEMQGMNEAQRNDEWARRGWDYVMREPLRIAKLAVMKIGRTWSPWFNASEDLRGGGGGAAIQVIMTLWHVPLFILGLLGIAAGGLELKSKAILLVPVVYFTGVHSLFLGSVRYRVPLMPVVCIFAAAGLIYLIGNVKLGKRSVDKVV
jgi:hypothetical protein